MNSRIIFHISKINCISNVNVVVRADDTDILIILLGNYHLFNNNIHVWMECGFKTKNNLRYIDVGQLYLALGPKMCKALPGFHVFTGSDYTSEFSHKAKCRPFTLLKNNSDIQEAFAALGHEVVVDDEVRAKLESFTCKMYGFHKETNVNNAKYEKFLQNYMPKSEKDHLSRIKAAHGSSIPICRSVLEMKIQRCNFVSGIWNQATQREIGDPETAGWKLHNEMYVINWFEGDQLPTSLQEILFTEDVIDESENEEDYDFGEDESDSDSEGIFEEN